MCIVPSTKLSRYYSRPDAKKCHTRRAADSPGSQRGGPHPRCQAPFLLASLAAKMFAARPLAEDGGDGIALVIRGGPIETRYCAVAVLGVMGPQLIHPVDKQPPICVVHISQLDP
jgi:hypothetical protein